MNNIKVIWELLETFIYWKMMHLKLNEKKFFCVLPVASEVRKPVMTVSEAGYYLCLDLVLWQLPGLLSEVAACFHLRVQFWYGVASPG